MANTIERCGGLCVRNANHAGGCYAPLEVRTEGDADDYWTRRNERILAIVMAPGTEIGSSKINRHPQLYVVVNGLTGLDACKPSLEECFEALLQEEDGGPSPGRIDIVIGRSITNPITSENAPEGASEVTP